MQQNDVKYLVFDIESVADEDLIKEVLYPNESITPREAREKYTAELLETKNTDFIPYTFQFPVTLAMALIDEDFNIISLPVLTFEKEGPGKLAEYFWRGWEKYLCPTLVSFNGKGFDIPMLEHMAFRYGISIPKWMVQTAVGNRITFGGGSGNARNRFNTTHHIDVMEQISNYHPFCGGMNLAAKSIGYPGKMETNGQEVQAMFDQKRFQDIHDYCRCDVLDTYFLFLRLLTISGRIQNESELVTLARERIEQEASERPIYNQYLEAWSRRRGTAALDEYCRRVQQ